MNGMPSPRYVRRGEKRREVATIYFHLRHHGAPPWGKSAGCGRQVASLIAKVGLIVAWVALSPKKVERRKLIVYFYLHNVCMRLSEAQNKPAGSVKLSGKRASSLPKSFV